MEHYRMEIRRDFIVATTDRINRYGAKLQIAPTHKVAGLKVLIRRSMDYRAKLLANCTMAKRFMKGNCCEKV